MEPPVTPPAQSRWSRYVTMLQHCEAVPPADIGVNAYATIEEMRDAWQGHIRAWCGGQPVASEKIAIRNVVLEYAVTSGGLRADLDAYAKQASPAALACALWEGALLLLVAAQFSRHIVVPPTTHGVDASLMTHPYARCALRYIDGAATVAQQLHGDTERWRTEQLHRLGEYLSTTYASLPPPYTSTHAIYATLCHGP